MIRNPEKKWSDDIIKSKDEKNLLTNDYLINLNDKLKQKTIKNRKRYSNSSSEEDDSEEEEHYSDEDSDNSRENER